jgi:Fas apoptotic inhibitory molecule (FAIM1)
MFERHLDFEFEVGETERHNVAFEWDQLWGPMTISVDGKRVVRKLGMFTLRRTSGYEFSVGSTETHKVRIEKTRKALVGGFQPQECVTYVDGQEVGRYSNAA